MNTEKDPRIDAYIAKSAEFAQPILKHLRTNVHAVCAEVEETMKWGMPHFMFKGILCHMAAFKEHCAFGFWKGAWLQKQLGDAYSAEAMGQFGRITSKKDLPPEKALRKYIAAAMAINEKRSESPVRSRPKIAKQLEIPSYFTRAVRANPEAWKTFQNFTPGNKREYVDWVAEAKREETRAQRMQTAIAWMAEGKIRNWKYVKR